jgi:molybdate transport system ATP-binding protein
MSLSVHIKKKLRDFDLTVDLETGSGCMGILGSSGCGKSMTLKCIAGLETPDEGRIVLNDRVLYDSERKINLPPQKRKVGYLFQNYALFPHMTVRKNLEAGINGCGDKLSRQEKNARVTGLLSQFHIEELVDSYPAKMSGGQQQRVALARIVASEPDILLLDEPFSALDSYLREKMLQEMSDFLKTYQRDVLMVSHNRDEVYQMCDRTAVMGIGKIEIAGDTRELFLRPETLGAARLTGCKNISAARKTDHNRIYAKDWGVELTMPGEIAEDIAYVGIRAHDLRVAHPGDINTMKCKLERISEAPFEMYLILESKGTSIWWKIPKNVWDSTEEQIPDRICFPPEHILLLRK